MARLDDTSDPTAYGQAPVGFAGPDVSGLNSSANAQGIDYGGSWFNPTLNSSSNNQAIDYGGSAYNPAPASWATPLGNPVNQTPTTYSQPASQQQAAGSGGMQTHTAATITPPPVHHNAAFFKSNGQAATDTTYQAQKAALVGKLNDYEGNIARQVGSGNMVHNDASNPDDLLGFSWSGKTLDPNGIYNQTQDQNGNLNFSAKDDAHGGIGGTLGADYSTGIANFNNQQQHGLRGIAEDFAARGMLGSGSGVWQTAKQNAQDQYNQQLTNMTNSTVNQYNNLLAGLGDQFSQGRGALTGYLTDASNRMATADALNLPTSV